MAWCIQRSIIQFQLRTEEHQREGREMQSKNEQWLHHLCAKFTSNTEKD